MSDEAKEALFVTVLLIAVIVLGSIIYDAVTPRSQDITIHGRSAIIHPGGRLILIEPAGKMRYQWTLTKQGNEVKMDCSGCFDRHPKLCGVGCTTHTDFGWLSPKLTITQLQNDELEVKWSWPVYNR